MKIIKNSFIVVLIILLNSCSNVDFGDTNVDPNSPTKDLTNALLSDALFITGNVATALTPGYYVQHYADIQYTDGERYGTAEFGYSGFYTGVLNNLERIISLNTNEATKSQVAVFGSNSNQIAVAKLVKAYTYHTMTDRWGQIPFTEANKPLEFSEPSFDSQEVIYDGIFNLIDDALAQIDNGSGPTGDILLEGNMTRWKEFGNTLKVIMALRLSDVSTEMTALSGISDYARTKFNEGITGAISSVANNIEFAYTSDDSTDNPWEDRYNGNRAPDYAVSDVLVDFLQDSNRNDPRISKYADEVPNAPGTYVGMIYDLITPNVDRADISYITGNIANNSEAPGYVYTYAQIAFAKAEAVEKGWMTGSAKSFYYEGIKASMDQWGVSNNDYNKYITETAVVWNASNSMKLIAEQKWASLFMQPFEAWAEWRRLDHPVLTPHSSPLNGTVIPVRMGYASGINDSNKAELDKAISKQGLPKFDDLGTKVFWDVN
ncbi:SusD/RagB family nutrient-binding outer membrane lipoprotein [Polaribacter sp. ALD11]|uniref:SusD/RagB family nutrient-binding outer membrane lipoprotein n=1 Tax=Polaribacter sp. ALD11 TaxID=2058137 RepID=UPI000C316444|nr:SusD/RagB family nutrient-binding outer membrane lipoprotein [Polaribacter sp. ALD11]AUC86287.1 SusD/RagB family nutrient-binding outer membrane lipoprotein [Polaribacter sp. ALD11]